MNRRPNNRDRVPLPSRTPGLGDDVPCSKCGAVALDTGLECDACGHDMAPELESPPAVVPAVPSDAVNATIIYGQLTDAARQRTSRENIEDVLAALSQTTQPQAETTDHGEAFVTLTIAQLSELTGRKMLDLMREAARCGITVTANEKFDALPLLCILATPPVATPTAPSEVTDEQIDEAVQNIFISDCDSSRSYDRAIARAVLALAQSAPVAAPSEVTDEQIDIVRCRTNIPQASDCDELRLTKADMRTFARAVLAALAQSAPVAAPAPIDMVLHCPACGLQHVDAPDERTPDWKNEPHRSHLCHGCGHIWRPADVPTNGVRAVLTKGKADSPIAAPAPASEAVAVLRFERGTPGRENDMPRVVSCKWQPDGECPVYLAALPQAGAEGWKLVPVEPTEAMLMAGRCVDIARGGWLMNLPVSDIRRIYCAMLAAAPASQPVDVAKTT